MGPMRKQSSAEENQRELLFLFGALPPRHIPDACAGTLYAMGWEVSGVIHSGQNLIFSSGLQIHRRRILGVFNCGRMNMSAYYTLCFICSVLNHTSLACSQLPCYPEDSLLFRRQKRAQRCLIDRVAHFYCLTCRRLACVRSFPSSRFM